MKKERNKTQRKNGLRFPDSMENAGKNALPDRTSHIPAMSPEWTKPTDLDDTPKPPYDPEDRPDNENR